MIHQPAVGPELMPYYLAWLAVLVGRGTEMGLGAIRWGDVAEWCRDHGIVDIDDQDLYFTVLCHADGAYRRAGKPAAERGVRPGLTLKPKAAKRG